MGKELGAAGISCSAQCHRGSLKGRRVRSERGGLRQQYPAPSRVLATAKQFLGFQLPGRLTRYIEVDKHG